MEVETKYIAPRAADFVALMQAPELAGYHLEPVPTVQVRDVYLDTEAGDLLRQGYVFRIREQPGRALATLKSLGGAEGALHRRLEVEAHLDVLVGDEGLPVLPEGPLRDALDALIGEHALAEVVHLRQYRAPRVVYDGSRLIGVLSFDVVAQQTPAGLHVTNEVEVELSDDGREEDLYRLDPILRARGLDPTTRSKFERGLQRQRRAPDAPLVVLPDERTALERYQDAGLPLHRRRARVVLLAAQGLREATIANKVGLSPARVRHWIEAFRTRALAIFEAEQNELVSSRRRVPRYRVSELVTGAEAPPALFREEHFASGVAGAGAEPLEPEEIVREEEVAFSQTPEAARADEQGAPVTFGPQGDGASASPPEVKAVESARTDDAVITPLPAPDPASERASDPPEPTDAVESLDELLDLFEAPVPPPPPSSTWPTTPKDADEEPEADEELDAGEELEDLLADDPAEEAEAPVPAEAESARARAPDTAPRPAIRRPVLDADEPVLAACSQVLHYQHARFADASARLSATWAARDVRRLLLFAHRIRIGLELFGDYLPPRPTERLHGGLRGVARALDGLGDLDLVRAHVADARAETSTAAQAALGRVVDALDEQREAARQAAAARLSGARHAVWLQRFERLLALVHHQVEAGLAAGDHLRSAPDDYLDDTTERPSRDRLRHMLGSTLWERYEALRAFDAVVTEADDTLLHPLGVTCAGLQYAFGLTAGCSDEDVRVVTEPLARLESHLALLHHARLTADALAPFAALAPVAALRDRVRTLRDEASAEVPERWEDVAGSGFRQALGRVVAAI